ncbi:peptidase [Bordetella parapertussis]|nr:peptidase [Bordetella parapertussis]
MNRGPNSLVRSFKRKVAALFAPPVEPTSRGGALLRRTLTVSALGLFAGAAALGMVQQPDRSELPPCA